MSLCLSVTRRYCVETAERIIKLFFHHRATTAFRLFSAKPYGDIPTGPPPPTGTLTASCMLIKSRFSTNRKSCAIYRMVPFPMTLSDLAKYWIPRSIARPICDRWIFCSGRQRAPSLPARGLRCKFPHQGLWQSPRTFSCIVFAPNGYTSWLLKLFLLVFDLANGVSTPTSLLGTPLVRAEENHPQDTPLPQTLALTSTLNTSHFVLYFDFEKCSWSNI